MRTLARKHRVVVELTVNVPITDKDAVSAMTELMGRIDMDARPLWCADPGIYAEKLTAKSFRRVVKANRD